MFLKPREYWDGGGVSISIYFGSQNSLSLSVIEFSLISFLLFLKS